MARLLRENACKLLHKICNYILVFRSKVTEKFFEFSCEKAQVVVNIMQKPFRASLNGVVTLLFTNRCLGFGIVDPTHLSNYPHSLNDASSVVSSFLDTYQSQTLAASNIGNNDILQQYRHSLDVYPLQTKMATGGFLAVAGDAIAQSRDVDQKYDKTRAASFMIFDMCYRALQHGAFPLIVQEFKGQYFTGLISALGLSSVLQDYLPLDYMAAMEQTLASQLGIVPFLYYPVFFSLTGAIQGLTAGQSIDRAKEKFLPLMKRNLLFWIPVQFIQFGFIEEGLQIPFLSACGLAWTFILSIMAGSAKSYNESNDEPDLQVTSSNNLKVKMGINSKKRYITENVKEDENALVR